MRFAWVYGTVGALAVGVCVWRVFVAARNPRSPARWAMTVAIGCSAVGFIAAVPQTYSWIGRTSGLSNLATVIVYAAETTAVFTQILWATYVFGPARAEGEVPEVLRTWTVAAVNVAVVFVMGVLFFLAPVNDGASHPINFDMYYATNPVVSAFLILYLAAFGWALVKIVAMCRRWIPQLQPGGWSRRGLILLAVGSSIAVAGYCGGKTVAIVADWAGVPMRLLSSDIAPAFASAGVVVMLCGYASPSLIPQAIIAIGYVRLKPLWSALRQAVPEVANAAAPGRRPVRERVYRQLVEIHDALVVLQPYLTVEIGPQAKDLAEELQIRASRRAAVIEAARIAAAIEARREGAVIAGRGERFRDPATPDLVGELAWYSSVAVAYRRSPLIPMLLADRRTRGGVADR